MIKSTHVFWFLLILCILAFTWRVYAEVTKTDTIIAPKSVETIKEVSIPPKTEKEAIVADIIHEEKKVDKVVIRVGLQGSMKPVNPLKWNTTDERAKEFLDRVGLGHTLPTWKAFWEKYWIDYTLPMAIAFADSHLWKALKSTNNLGNIGNNDRWDVVHYATLDAWIEAIFRSLKYGKYMQGHTIIGTLSGEGRKRMWLPSCTEEKDYRKKCYATSMWVWSTNVTNALSVIHNKQIDETYNFRL